MFRDLDRYTICRDFKNFETSCGVIHTCLGLQINLQYTSLPTICQPNTINLKFIFYKKNNIHVSFKILNNITYAKKMLSCNSITSFNYIKYPAKHEPYILRVKQFLCFFFLKNLKGKPIYSLKKKSKIIFFLKG